MAEIYNHNYNRQIEAHISQFLRVFSGFQYEKNSNGDLERIAVVYGPMDRIVANIMQNRKSFPNQKVPLISAVLSGMNRNDEAKRATDYSGSTTIKKQSNNEYTTLSRLIGPAFTLQMDVSILAGSVAQLFEIVEQILLIFNPRVTIQKDDAIENQNYNTEISLTGINNEINYPLGTESKFVSMTLNFEFDIRLNYPHRFDENIVKKIESNIFDSSYVDDGANIDDFSIEENDV